MSTLPVLSHAPEKPRHGEPCNGCGYCCVAEVCEVGVAVYGNVPAPCPGMNFHDGRFWCGVVETLGDTRMGALIRFSLGIGIGVGCDADDPEGYR